MTRMSQAFAAFRQSLITDLNNLLVEEFVPQFNSEAEDIRREHEIISNNPKKGEALADHKKRARIQDLVVRRGLFIASLQTKLKNDLFSRVESYGGVIREDKDDKSDKNILRAHFPDNSMAKVPKSLWIDFKMFDRV